MNSSYENAFPTADEDYAKRKTIFKMGEEKKNHYTLHTLKLMKFLKTFFFFLSYLASSGENYNSFQLEGNT